MPNNDKLHEECAIFGIFAPQEDVARISFFGLYALQHRGQESAGIACSDSKNIAIHKKMGLVSQVFDEESLLNLQGNCAIGHTRYSTTGNSVIENAQPLLFKSNMGEFCLAHNGNLVNSQILKGKLSNHGSSFNTNSDSEIIGKIIAEQKGKNWIDKIRKGLKKIKGSYSLVILTNNQIFAVRDPLGVRPLVLGKFNDGWVIASESCALDTIGAKIIREIFPGEGVIIDANGVVQFQPPSKRKNAFCIFEYIYFSRPDSILNDRLVYEARKEMGRQLCREYPVGADFVIPVPDSATAAAIGFAEEAHIPFYEGLIKSRYIGRTFIQPDLNLRKMGVKLKFNVLPQIIKNKKIVVVDDSIVRGNTTKQIVQILRQAGAQQIHLRISSPPLRHPCYLGIDIATYKELIAHQKSIEEIRKFLAVETLGYLSLQGLKKSIGVVSCEYCTGCFTGKYPVKLKEIKNEDIINTSNLKLKKKLPYTNNILN